MPRPDQRRSVRSVTPTGGSRTFRLEGAGIFVSVSYQELRDGQASQDRRAVCRVWKDREADAAGVGAYLRQGGGQWACATADERPMILEREIKSVEARFWVKVCKTSGCWWWTGAISDPSQRGGYGRFLFRGVNRCAPRIAYELTYGAIPAGLWVLHRC